jgi:hypothetical protein
MAMGAPKVPGLLQVFAEATKTPGGKDALGKGAKFLASEER